MVTRGDLVLNSALYAQAAEGVRPDVRILDQEMLTFPWMKPYLARLMPDITIPGAYYHISVVSLKKSCTSVAAQVRCAHAEKTPPQADVAD